MSTRRRTPLGRAAEGGAEAGPGAEADLDRADDAGAGVPREGCIVPQHSHENEQLTYILEGKLRFWLGEDESEVVDVGAGEVLHLPSWLPHKAEAMETTLDVDIFCPPRQDWLDGSDAYLRTSSQ